ncbi:5120_t:CDS:2 [Dentiscutata erythropus]|uniref:5120_t:CDS:1 n=1 Tax=Dentiscutata erythropus TaxID=1348616 RepID=A0A9N8ZH78_9GLOM|nr:5120_t:CDS:2 [Dentiscutata erythropus]
MDRQKIKDWVFNLKHEYSKLAFFIITSKALIRSVATNSNVASSIRYKSRTLPRVSRSKSGHTLSSTKAAPTTTEELKRWSWRWWKEWAIIFIVFGITGSTTVRIVRPVLTNILGIEGGFIDGPWTYRISYLCVTIPLYSLILFIVGTIFRRQAYFKKIVFRMYGRFIPERLIKRIRGGRNNDNNIV